MASSDKYKSCVGQEEKRDGRRGRKAELVMMQKEIGYKERLVALGDGAKMC